MARTAAFVEIAGLVWDPDGDPPAQQVYAALRERILDGRLRAGARLPSTRFLSASLQVPRGAVVRSYEMLRIRGYVSSRSGAGTIVSHLTNAVAAPAPRRSASAVNVSTFGRRVQDIFAESSSGQPRAFSPGVPAVDDFPMKIWKSLVSRTWSSPAALLAAPKNDPGLPFLRETLAVHAGVSRGVRCSPEQIIIVNGTQHGIDLASRLLLECGDTVVCEDPGYLPARSAFAGWRAQVMPVAIDGEGLMVDNMALQCAGRRERHGRGPSMIYVTPSVHYPTGVRMSPERRKALLNLASRSGAWILEDDYCGELYLDGMGSPALQSEERDGRLIYIGTFSGLLASQLNFGYLIVPSNLAGRFRAARALSGQGPSVFDQAVMARFIADGHMDAHIHRTRMKYRERAEQLRSELARELGGVMVARQPAGGMQLVATLTGDHDAEAIACRAGELGIEAPPLGRFTSGPPLPALILGYGAVRPESIGPAVRLLAGAVQDVSAGRLAGRVRSSRR